MKPPAAYGDTAEVELAGRGPACDVVTPAVLEWVSRVSPGARISGCTVRPLAGGAVAAFVDQVTLHLADGHDPLELVRKAASAHEIAGLRAAQAVRPSASAVPELVASGDGLVITPMAAGAPLAPGAPVPANLIDTLAVLHARYSGDSDLATSIPRVNSVWWERLCRGWVDPGLRENAGRHPAPVMARALALIERAAALPAVPSVLGGLTPTLLHGDVHTGNVLVDGDRAVLVDWGSSRIGPAALDLTNLVAADSAEVARYARTWQRLTGLTADEIDLGFQWAALQIPVQYLPWTAGHRATSAFEAALDQIELAMRSLPA